MQKIIHRNFNIAILLNIVLFATFLSLFNLRFNTDTDIYFLYTLSGGFGNEPSALLHYYNIAHPILSSIVAVFFKYFPSFNWYSFFLLVFHFISCGVLLYSFLNYFRRSYALIIYIIVFLFIECRLLLWLDFSGASLIGAISGSISLLFYLKDKNAKGAVYNKKVVLFCLLILMAGLIRFHFMAFFAVCATCIALFFLSPKQLIQFLKIHFLLGLLVVLLFQGQRYYFQQRIPGWAQEEKTRKAQIYYSNHPHKTSLSLQTGIEKLKQDLISVFLLYDKNLTDYNSVEKFGKNNTKLLNISQQSSQSLYWLFMDVRPYLFLFGIIILLLAMNRDRRSLFRFMYISILFIMIFIVFALFLKITEVILVAILFSIFASGFVYCGGKTCPKNIGIVIFLLLLNCTWMVVRLIKTSSQNKSRIVQSRNIINQFNAHRNTLFVDAGSLFDFNLSIWDTPHQYPLDNYIYKELFFSNSYGSQLARFGISDLMKEIPVNNNIYLAGEKATILIEYYKILYNLTVEAKKVEGFRYIDIYRIIPASYK